MIKPSIILAIILLLVGAGDRLRAQTQFGGEIPFNNGSLREIAYSGDGTTLAINNSIYYLVNGSWTRSASISGPVSGEPFADKIALSYDGQTLVTAHFQADAVNSSTAKVGAVHVFHDVRLVRVGRAVLLSARSEIRGAAGGIPLIGLHSTDPFL